MIVKERKEFEREPPGEKQRDTLRYFVVTAPPSPHPQTQLQIGIAS